MLEPSGEIARPERPRRPLTPEEKWVRQLGSLWPARRKRALQALAERGSAVTDLLLATYKRNDQAVRSGRRRVFFYGAVAMVFMLLGILVINWLRAERGSFSDFVYIFNVLFGVGICAMIAEAVSSFYMTSFAKANTEMMGLLAVMDDPRVSGILAESLKTPLMLGVPASYRAQRQTIEATLIRLLPQLTEQNIPDWNASQRGGLRTVLKRAAKATVIKPESVPLVCATLEAITTLGDLQAQAVVGQLAKRTPQTETETAVVAAAQRCEEALQQWRERNRNGEMLLRGSALPTTAPETLLRVAPVAVREEPQQLLRASTTAKPD